MCTNEILKAINKDYFDIAKKKHGRIPEFTYGEIIDRIINVSGRISIEEVFPELASRISVTTMLKKAFPNKISTANKQPWFNYLLSLVNKKYCAVCDTIKNNNDFANNESRFDGLHHKCKTCDAISGKAYRDNNKDKEKDRAHLYYTNHKAETRARSILRKSFQRQATPSWANLAVMNEIYKNCPEGYHVDHIIPLQGKLVCGLHVENNLQYLTVEDNLRKGNKFEV